VSEVTCYDHRKSEKLMCDHLADETLGARADALSQTVHVEESILPDYLVITQTYQTLPCPSYNTVSEYLPGKDILL